jgi:ABC-2 type transport system ATP-binding protein
MRAGAIVADRLTKRVWGRTLVEDVSFGVAPGRVMGLLGPNGAGKTTTIRMLLGLSRPSRGQALLSGQPVPGPALRVTGSMIDHPGLYSWMSATGNLKALAPDHPRSGHSELLGRVGLHSVGNKLVHAYSHGMKQRLALAVAIANGPDALILDEPASGLDPTGTREFRGLIRSLAAEGRAILVSSHQLAEVERLCDVVVVLDRGRVMDQFALTPDAHETARSSSALEARYMSLTDQSRAR